MKNFKQETLDALAENGKVTGDIKFVNTREGSITWEQFVELSDFQYDDGYGGAEIAQSMKVVGDNWWLERGEYDGSEWWEFKTLPVQLQPILNPSKRDLKDRDYD